MRNNSDLALLNAELELTIWTRSMEVINVALFAITFRIVQKNSSKSIGAYKNCIYQILGIALISQQPSLLGPIFCMPILGGFVTVELIRTPFAVHLVVVCWFVLIFLDIESIMDGFNYRCRVLLKIFHPQYTNKYFWIGISVLAKTISLTCIPSLFIPVGLKMNKLKMRTFIETNYPNVLPVFDARGSFVVYEYEMMKDEMTLVVFFFLGVFLLCGDCFLAIVFVFCILHFQRDKMSSTTRKMHARFVVQLLFQASVPLLTCVCPFLALAVLLLIETSFTTNLCGYIILSLMMMHGPLTSIMTIALYDPYRKAVLNIVCRKKNAPAVLASVTSNISSNNK